MFKNITLNQTGNAIFQTTSNLLKKIDDYRRFQACQLPSILFPNAIKEIKLEFNRIDPEKQLNGFYTNELDKSISIELQLEEYAENLIRGGNYNEVFKDLILSESKRELEPAAFEEVQQNLILNKEQLEYERMENVLPDSIAEVLVVEPSKFDDIEDSSDSEDISESENEEEEEEEKPKGKASGSAEKKTMATLEDLAHTEQAKKSIDQSKTPAQPFTETPDPKQKVIKPRRIVPVLISSESINIKFPDKYTVNNPYSPELFTIITGYEVKLWDYFTQVDSVIQSNLKNTFIRNLKEKSFFKGGNFKTISLRKLNEALTPIQGADDRIKIKLHLLKKPGGPSEKENLYTILSKLPIASDAVFQIESTTRTLDSLDISHYFTNPKSNLNKKIALCTLPGTISRLYYNTTTTENRNEINLLENIKDYIASEQNGAIDLSLKGISSFDEEKLQQIYENLCICYQAETQVVLSLRKTGELIAFKEKSMADQVFCVSLDINEASTVGKMNRQLDKEGVIANLILRSQYEAAYLSAIINKKQTLFLTMLGYEQGNPIVSIISAIINAHRKWGLKKYLRNIELFHIYKDDNEVQAIKENLRDYAEFKEETLVI